MYLRSAFFNLTGRLLGPRGNTLKEMQVLYMYIRDREGGRGEETRKKTDRGRDVEKKEIQRRR